MAVGSLFKQSHLTVGPRRCDAKLDEMQMHENGEYVTNDLRRVFTHPISHDSIALNRVFAKVELST